MPRWYRSNSNKGDFEMTTEYQSPTAAAMEHLELYGGYQALRGLDEPDPRSTPLSEAVENAMNDILDIFDTLAKDTKLEDHVAEIASSMATSFHFMLKRAADKEDSAANEVASMSKNFDGSEINDVKLQQQKNLLDDCWERSQMIEELRNVIAAQVHARYGQVWNPPTPKDPNKTSRIQAEFQSTVEASKMLKAKAKRDQDALIVEGTMIAFAGGKDYQDVTTIWDYLDKVKHSLEERGEKMVLVHGGAPGAERIASKWADQRKVEQVVCPPDWKGHGKAAPFRRNDEMLKLDLQGLIATPGTGITENLVDKAREQKITTKRIGGATEAPKKRSLTNMRKAPNKDTSEQF